MNPARLTVREAAAALRVSPGLVYALCATGALTHERHGLGRGTIRIPADALREYEQRARVAPAPQRMTRAEPRSYTHLDAARLAKAWQKRGPAPDGEPDKARE